MSECERGREREGGRKGGEKESSFFGRHKLRITHTHTRTHTQTHSTGHTSTYSLTHIHKHTHTHTHTHTYTVFMLPSAQNEALKPADYAWQVYLCLFLSVSRMVTSLSLSQSLSLQYESCSPIGILLNYMLTLKPETRNAGAEQRPGGALQRSRAPSAPGSSWCRPPRRWCVCVCVRARIRVFSACVFFARVCVCV